MTKTVELIREFDKVTEHIYIQHTQTKKSFSLYFQQWGEIFIHNNGKTYRISGIKFYKVQDLQKGNS